MKFGTRQYALAGALALTLGATAWTSLRQSHLEEGVENDIATPISQPNRSKGPEDRPAQKGILLVAAMSRTLSHRSIKDLFAGKSWHPAPPPVQLARQQPPAPPIITQPAPPPAPPLPPPLPFRFIGKMQEANGAWRIFLLKGSTVYIAREGDVLDGSYRVMKINKNDVSILSLPFQREQVLALGGTS